MKSIIYINYLYFFGSSFVLTKVQTNNSASTITFNEHIAPIFYANYGCHHNVEGPFSLIIKTLIIWEMPQSSVLSGYMPHGLQILITQDFDMKGYYLTK